MVLRVKFFGRIVGRVSLSDSEQKILQRLSGRSVGMTARELARFLKSRPSDVNQDLLRLQQEGQVALRNGKWCAVHARADLGSNVSSGAESLSSGQPISVGRQTVPSPNDQPSARRSQPIHSVDKPSKLSLDRRGSRWSTFRRLCDYYAECVRLDQRSSISATAEDEFESVVCIDGALPHSQELRIRTREAWHKWVRKVPEDDYVFVGYPLQRYRWRDTTKSEDVDFVTPVFILPCRARLDATELELEAVGPIRVNEGWLERRLKDLDQRRTFLELCGTDSGGEDGINATTWYECARLLSHFYHDWCAENLDTNQLRSTPPLVELKKDGIYNRAGLFLSKKLKYTSKLYGELLELANEIPDHLLDQSALAQFFPHGSGEPLESQSAESREEAESPNLVGAQVLTMNHEQLQATKAAAESVLSIVVGPPGTGKSRVVAAVLAQQALLGRSALLASRNHQALEAVVPRVNALSEPWPIMLRLARPWGAPVDMSMHAAIDQLVSSDLAGDREHLNKIKTALAGRIAEHQEASLTVARLGELRDSLRKRVFEFDEVMRRIPEPFQSIACQYHQDLPDEAAVQSVVNLLAERESFRWSIQWIWNRLFEAKRWRAGVHRAVSIDASMKRVFDKTGSLPTPASSISPEMVAYCRQVIEFWRPMVTANSASKAMHELRTALDALPPTDQACRREHDAAQEVAKLSAECFFELAKQSGAEISDEERSLLANILATIANRSALDTEADHRRWSEAMRKAFPIFLKHFPLAATTNLSVRRDISLQPAFFDLLVIDEASQCDVASVIPLLFRARRTMIVGDPMQLSHVTSLSPETDRHLRRQFGVDDIDLERFSYRTSSLFHLANTSPTVNSRVSLRQHHRCHPSIAAYCSETFYKGSWTVLTEDTGKRGILWTDVSDDSQPAAGGGAVSQAQIYSICAEVERLAASGYAGTLGVVTPFRQQANRLRDAIHQTVPHVFVVGSRLLVDTADGFQGDERDVVLFSLVGGEDLTEGSLRFLAGGPNRFNVAVSRAKQQLHVFGDLKWARNCSIWHIKALADFCDREAAERARATETGFRADLVGPVWEPALAEAMRAAGLEFHQQYPACGRYLDFALFRDGLKLDVEVDGEAYHRSGSGDRVTDDIRRDQALIANGWTILRFWVYELREDMERCVSQIAQAVGNKLPTDR